LGLLFYFRLIFFSCFFWGFCGVDDGFLFFPSFLFLLSFWACIYLKELNCLLYGGLCFKIDIRVSPLEEGLSEFANVLLWSSPEDLIGGVIALGELSGVISFEQ